MKTDKKRNARFDFKTSEEQIKILTSQKDSKIFFDALLNPPKPNEELLKAADVYVKHMSK